MYTFIDRITFTILVKCLLLEALLLQMVLAMAIYISISMERLVNRATSVGSINPSNDVTIKFDLSWKNSRRISTKYINYNVDGIFNKYKTGMLGQALYTLVNKNVTL